MKNSLLPIWLSIIVVLVAGYGFFLAWRNHAAQDKTVIPSHVSLVETETGPPLTEFTLTERSGRQFDSRSLDGEVWVASVFFASCPSVCLELNKNLAEIQRDPKFAGARFVSITCDPRNDTPEVMSNYARRFAADPQRWMFCTGDQKYIERIARDMLQISVQGVTHSQRAIIFDRTGKMRGGFVITDPRLVADRVNFEETLLKCLAEPRPAPERKSAAKPDEPPADRAAAAPVEAEKAAVP